MRPAARLRIVYLEDDESAFDLIRSLLIDAGLDCDFVHVLDEAGYRAALAPIAPDAILSDFNLPTIDGLTALELRRELCPDTPFIFVSGALGEAAAIDLLKAGATDFVLKDTLPRLVPAIRRSLAEATEHRERMHAEQSLRESEARFRRLAENAPDVIFRYRMEPAGLRCEYISPAVEKMCGYRPEEFYASRRMVLRIVHPADRPILFEILTTRKIPDELKAIRWICRDGRTIVTEQRFVPVHDADGRRIAFEGIARDVTERQRTAEQVLLLSHAIAESPVGVDITDADCRLAFVSDSLCAMSGYSREELIGRDLGLLHSPQTPAGFRTEVNALLQNGQTWHGELTCRRKNGEDYIVRASMTPLRDERGAMRHCVAVKEDITQWKKEQEGRRLLELQLVQAQRMESIGTLAGGIAHDFNNILTGILGFTELAEVALPAGHEARECLGEVRRAGTRAKELVTQLLTFSRQKESGLLPIDLARVVGEAVRFIRASLPATIEIERKLAPGRVQADPTQIHQVVMNLCTNAMHAMRGKPGLLAVHIDPLKVDEDLAATVPGLVPGAYLRLSVRDTGHGIDTATLQRIFDPFYTTKQIGEGTGLGLALVQSIVAAHHGGIRVTSAVGQGSTFEIFLPVCVEHEPAAAPAEPVVPGQGENVLLVDDEISVGTFARVRLEQLNYRVTVLTDPRQALAALRANPGGFAALFTDYTMPNLTGLDLLREIHTAGLALPAVIATGNRAAVSATALAEFPGTLLIDKPYTGESLARALHAVLRPAITDTPRAR